MPARLPCQAGQVSTAFFRAVAFIKLYQHTGKATRGKHGDEKITEHPQGDHATQYRHQPVNGVIKAGHQLRARHCDGACYESAKQQGQCGPDSQGLEQHNPATAGYAFTLGKRLRGRVPGQQHQGQ